MCIPWSLNPQPTHPPFDTTQQPERMQNRLYRVWHHISAFSLLLVVVAGTGIAYWLESKRGLDLHVLGDLASGLGRPEFPALGKFAFNKMIMPAVQVALLVRNACCYYNLRMDQGWRDPCPGVYISYCLAFPPLNFLHFHHNVCTNSRTSKRPASPASTPAPSGTRSTPTRTSCAFGGVVVSGSSSRTALSADVGGRSTLTNLYLGARILRCTNNQGKHAPIHG